jgi:hypothetical protein
MAHANANSQSLRVPFVAIDLADTLLTAHHPLRPHLTSDHTSV